MLFQRWSTEEKEMLLDALEKDQEQLYEGKLRPGLTAGDRERAWEELAARISKILYFTK